MTELGQMIVVVEDDDGLRRALQRVLVAGGYRARTFDSAEALLAGDGTAGADCLLLDIHLPGSSGLTLYEGLGPGRPPAVFMTANAGSGVREAAQRMGAIALLSKPFLGSVLLDAMARATASAPRR